MEEQKYDYKTNVKRKNLKEDERWAEKRRGWVKIKE